jgi:hypothetical protein
MDALTKPGDLQRERAGRLAFLFISATLIGNFFAGMSVFQLHGPVLRFAYVDPLYWVLHALAIPDTIVGSPVIALLFDAALLITSVLIARFPAGRKRYWLFFALYGLYFAIINTYGAHHAHPKVGILLVSAVFLFPLRHFRFAWEAARYYAAFLFFDAFLWKAWRGTLVDADQGILIIRHNYTGLLAWRPDSLLAHVYSFFLRQPLFVNILYKVGVLCEGAFLIAFFTKRFDRLFGRLVILLPLGFLAYAEAYFFEMWVMALLFWIKPIAQKDVPAPLPR